LTHDPNVLDAYSDLKRSFEPPPPAAPAAAQPTAPSTAPTVGERIATPEKREEERLRKQFDEELAKLKEKVAEANGQTKAPGGPPLAFIADPTCAPVGRQWLVTGKVYNPSDKVRVAKATITLLIDGEPAKAETVEVGPVGPNQVAPYQVLFRPSRNTRNRTVTASAAWKG
jgi:hypothetical protein